MTSAAEVGKLGEEFAEEYLKSKGYRIIEKNYKTKRAEIDVVASKKDSTLVFVEVRTKSDEHFGTPEETINYKKKQKLMQNAKGYVARKKYGGPYQIDAICIVLGPNRKPQKFVHYENIIE